MCIILRRSLVMWKNMRLIIKTHLPLLDLSANEAKHSQASPSLIKHWLCDHKLFLWNPWRWWKDAVLLTIKKHFRLVSCMKYQKKSLHEFVLCHKSRVHCRRCRPSRFCSCSMNTMVLSEVSKQIVQKPKVWKLHQTHHKISLSGWMSTCTSFGFWTEKLMVTYFFRSNQCACAGWLWKRISKERLLFWSVAPNSSSWRHVWMLLFIVQRSGWQYLPHLWSDDFGLVHSDSFWKFKREGTVITRQ